MATAAIARHAALPAAVQMQLLRHAEAGTGQAERIAEQLARNDALSYETWSALLDYQGGPNLDRWIATSPVTGAHIDEFHQRTDSLDAILISAELWGITRTAEQKLHQRGLDKNQAEFALRLPGISAEAVGNLVPDATFRTRARWARSNEALFGTGASTVADLIEHGSPDLIAGWSERHRGAYENHLGGLTGIRRLRAATLTTYLSETCIDDALDLYLDGTDLPASATVQVFQNVIAHPALRRHQLDRLRKFSDDAPATYVGRRDKFHRTRLLAMIRQELTDRDGISSPGCTAPLCEITDRGELNEVLRWCARALTRIEDDIAATAAWAVTVIAANPRLGTKNATTFYVAANKVAGELDHRARRDLNATASRLGEETSLDETEPVWGDIDCAKVFADDHYPYFDAGRRHNDDAVGETSVQSLKIGAAPEVIIAWFERRLGNDAVAWSILVSFIDDYTGTCTEALAHIDRLRS